MKLNSKNRSSHPDLFCKKDIFKNFAKFTGKHLSYSLFFNKVEGLRLFNRAPPWMLLKNQKRSKSVEITDKPP